MIVPTRMDIADGGDGSELSTRHVFAVTPTDWRSWIMDSFTIHYSGMSFESGDSPDHVEKKVRHRMVPLGQVLGVEATHLYPDEMNSQGDNSVVSFEGEIEVQADTQEKAENQGYDLLSHLGQITLVVSKKEKE